MYIFAMMAHMLRWQLPGGVPEASVRQSQARCACLGCRHATQGPVPTITTSSGCVLADLLLLCLQSSLGRQAESSRPSTAAYR